MLPKPCLDHSMKQRMNIMKRSVLSFIALAIILAYVLTLAAAFPTSKRPQTPQIDSFDQHGNLMLPSAEQLEISRRLFRAKYPAPYSIVHHDHKGRPVSLEQISVSSYRDDSESFTVIGSANLYDSWQNVSEFRVTINNPSLLPGSVQAAKEAFQIVANAWRSGTNISTKVLIHFDNSTADLIMKGRPTKYYLKEDVMYPSAIYDYISGIDYDSDLYELDIVVNPLVAWYTGNGTPAQTQYDFQSFLIHEAQHGLYLNSNYQVNQQGIGSLNGYRTAFDRFVAVNPVYTGFSSGICDVSGYLRFNINESQKLADALTSGNLMFAMKTTFASAYYGLYAPKQFVQGSSVVHLDLNSSHTSEFCDELMSYDMKPGKSYRCIGSDTLRISNICLVASLEGATAEPVYLCSNECMGSPVGCTLPCRCSLLPPGCFPSDGVVKNSKNKIALVKDLHAGDLVFDGQEWTEVVLAVDLKKSTNVMMYIHGKPIATMSHAEPSGLSAADYILASHEAIFLVFTKSRYIQVNGVRVSNYVSTYPIAIQEFGIRLVEKSSVARFLVSKYRSSWWYGLALTWLTSLNTWLS